MVDGLWGVDCGDIIELGVEVLVPPGLQGIRVGGAGNHHHQGALAVRQFGLQQRSNLIKFLPYIWFKKKIISSNASFLVSLMQQSSYIRVISSFF